MFQLICGGVGKRQHQDAVYRQWSLSSMAKKQANIEIGDGIGFACPGARLNQPVTGQRKGVGCKIDHALHWCCVRGS